MPQIRPPAVGAFGEKKKLWSVLPKPHSLGSSGETSSRPTIGTMVRTIRFQSGAMLIGITGWMFSVYHWPSSSGPPPKAALNWNGTLIRLAMGFESCLARSSLLSWADTGAGVVDAPTTSAIAATNPVLRMTQAPLRDSIDQNSPRPPEADSTRDRRSIMRAISAASSSTRRRYSERREAPGSEVDRFQRASAVSASWKSSQSERNAPSDSASRRISKLLSGNRRTAADTDLSMAHDSPWPDANLSSY